MVANAQHRLEMANPDGANDSPGMDEMERGLKHGIVPKRKLPTEELGDDKDE